MGSFCFVTSPLPRPRAAFDTLEARTPALHGRPDADFLTAREREVATLAARGLSNREVATRLFVSLRTVENHLHRAFSKLGVTRRHQLAGALGVGPGGLT